MFKRMVLFLLTNLAIIAVISIILSVFNVSPYLTAQGLNYQALMAYSLIVGFTGAFISLLISKWMAKSAYNITLIDRPSNDLEVWLVSKITELAKQARIGMPEVGIYESPEPNAFATGWNRNNALLAVSTGLLQTMDKNELEGVLGHEISHIANGDMVTMTLLQGVVNTFVIFFARIAAYLVTQFFQRDSDEETPVVGGFVYYAVAFIFELLFGILASLIVMGFSRYREYRADAGSAKLVGKYKMVKALQRLEELTNAPQDERAPALSTLKIARNNRSFLSMFASHPPIVDRIAALQKQDS